MPLPTYSTTRTDYPAPLEGQDVTGGTFGPAGRAAADEALMSGLGTSLIAHTFSGGPQVSHDDAAKELKSEGLDASVLPKDSISSGYLGAIKQQQIRIQEDRDLQNRATQISTFGRTVAGFGGAAADPLFLGIGAVTGGFGIGARGAGLIVRSATGAAEGAGAMTAYDIGRKELGTAQGDPDINSAQILHDAAWGGAAGGLLKGAFGPRVGATPVLAQHETFLQDNVPGIQITSGLRSPQHNAAIGGALHSMHLSGEAVDFVLPRGVTADEVKAAIEKKGLPITEWFIENKGDLHSTGDHIHWGWGEKGRTQFGLRPETQQAAAESAVAQVATDADVDVKPVLDQDESFRTNPAKIAMEHEADVSRILSEGAQAAVPKPGSIFTDDPDAAALSKRIESEPVKLAPAVEGENPELADLHKMTGDAVQEAEQAHALAHPQGLVVARRLPDGSIKIGEPGEIHASLYSEQELFGKNRTVSGEEYDKQSGFATPQGKFLTREQARDWVKQNQPAVAAEHDRIVHESGRTEAAGYKDTLIAEAYRMAGGVEPEGEESPLHTALAADDGAIKNDSDLAKAIDAAVRCATVKGLA